MFWQVLVPFIVREEVHTDVCLILKCYRDRAKIKKKHSELLSVSCGKFYFNYKAVIK